MRLHSWMNCAPFSASSENRIPLLARMPTGNPQIEPQPHTSLAAVERLELLEPAAVEHPGDDLAHVERHPHVGRRATEQLVGVVQRRVGGLARARAELAPAEVAHDLAADPQRVQLVDGEVVRQAARARVHLGAAERLLVDDLVDRHLHQRRAAEVDRAAALHHHHVVAHAGDVGAAGGRRAEHERDRRDAHPARAG